MSETDMPIIPTPSADALDPALAAILDRFDGRVESVDITTRVGDRERRYVVTLMPPGETGR